MEAVGELKKPVAISILVVFGTMIAIGSAFAAAYFAFDLEPPNSSGMINTVVSTIAGVSWFARKMNRRMLNAERLWFAVGVTVVNAIVPVAFVVGSLLYVGLPVSLASFDLAFGEGKGFLLEAWFAWLMVFIMGLAFVQAYFFAWLLPRKLHDETAASTEAA